MSKPEFFITPVTVSDNRGCTTTQAVKTGHRVETSGQGRWNDRWEFPEAIADEIAQAFRNVTAIVSE